MSDDPFAEFSKRIERMEQLLEAVAEAVVSGDAKMRLNGWRREPDGHWSKIIARGPRPVVEENIPEGVGSGNARS